MFRGFGPIVAGLVAILAASAARGSSPEAKWTPRSVAAAVEATAMKTSFGQLEGFGRASLSLPAPERLSRLQHVAWTFLNQGDFSRFAYWNAALAREAEAAGDSSFVAVAQLNALRSRYDQGDEAAAAEIRTAAERPLDWFARVHALTALAYVEVREGQTGVALRTLSDAESLVPDKDPRAAMARSRIWEIDAIGLMMLNDINGTAVALGRQEFEFGSPGYPRPDYDGVENLATLAARIGDVGLGQTLAGSMHRLAMRSGLPSSRAWDRVVCVRVGLLTSPRDALKCFDGLGVNLGEAAFVAPRLLPSRALAEAQTGQLGAAKRDADAAHKLLNAGAFSKTQFERLDDADAAILAAEGHPAMAYQRLMASETKDRLDTANRFSAGVGQITAQMQQQLDARRDQLATAQRNEALQHDMFATRNLLDGAVILVIGGFIFLLVLQRRHALALRQARTEAVNANRAKSEFLANMSHEIRTPLNGVVAMADMLTRAELDPKSREMAGIIHASGDTLLRLLNDILDLSRIESGKVTIEAAPFHVGDMMRAVAGLSALKCEEKGVQLRLEIAPEIDHMVVGDVVRVRQVVSNLLSNAVKFTERGEVRVSATRSADGLARFTVTDSGVGFATADKPKVLARFEQADASITRRFGGTGLGLSICSELASLMGGRLDCKSALGIGSTFWLEAPLPPVADTAPIEATRTARDPAADVEGAPLRILMADDHPTNRKVFELMLDGQVELDTVENGQQAVERVRLASYDVILMDMQMPVMDGLTAIREIRKLEAEGASRTPIIMLTANAMPEHVSSALASGADLFLAKPFTAPSLYDAIADALSRHGAAERAA
jgi:signal transduction histidine kinase/CheY-like chemotaxis protein